MIPQLSVEMQEVQQLQLCIRNLPPGCIRHELKQVLLEYGPIRRLFVSMNNDRPQYAQMTFEDEEDAYTAQKKLDRYLYGKNPIIVSAYKKRFFRRKQQCQKMEAEHVPKQKEKSRKQYKKKHKSHKHNDSQFYYKPEPPKRRQLRSHWKQDERQPSPLWSSSSEENKKSKDQPVNKYCNLADGNNQMQDSLVDSCESDYWNSVEKEYQELYKEETKWMKEFVRYKSEEGEVSSDQSLKKAKKKKQKKERPKKSSRRENKISPQLTFHVGSSRSNSSLD